MAEELEYQGPDPLEGARNKLDFGAMAASTPPVKAILFKAQTMGPLGTPRNGEKLGKAAAAAGLSLALVLAPWIPVTQSMTVLRISFEKPMQRQEAQNMVNMLLGFNPTDSLLAAEFAPDAGIPDVPGYLQLSVTGFDKPIEELRRQYATAIAQKDPGAEASVSLQEQFSRTTRHSPAGMLIQRFTPDEDLTLLRGPGSELGHDVMAHKELLADALDKRLQRLRPDYRLVDIGFLTSGSPQETAYDFVAPAWPLPIGLSVSQYMNLTEGEQAQIRAAASDLLDRLNMDQGTYDFASLPSAGLPIQVIVTNANGKVDSYLTAHLQSVIQQPRPDELRAINFNVQTVLTEAMRAFLPSAEYKLDYNVSPSAGRGAQPRYLISVTITGELSEAEIRTAQKDERIEEESVLDEAAGMDW